MKKSKVIAVIICLIIILLMLLRLFIGGTTLSGKIIRIIWIGFGVLVTTITAVNLIKGKRN